LDHFHVGLDERDVDAVRQQRLADHLCEAPEANDEHPPQQAVGLVDPVERCRLARDEPLHPDDEEGRQRHGQDHDGRHRGGRRRVEQSGRERCAVEDEGELPALSKGRCSLQSLAVPRPEQPGNAIDAQRLDQHEQQHATENDRPGAATTARSSDMPTLRKNRPSRMPRNGSMSASSWWRKVDSDSRRPPETRPSPSKGRPTA
jgi:hypothetical protein